MKDNLPLNSFGDTYTVSDSGFYSVNVSFSGCTVVSNGVTVDINPPTPSFCTLNIPTGLQTINPVGNYSVTLQWQQVNPYQDSSFIVRVYTQINPTGFYRYKVLHNKATSTSIGSLSPNTPYWAQVRTKVPINGALYKSPYCDPISFTTGLTACPPVTGLNAPAGEVTNNTALVYFNTTNAKLYTIRYIGNKQD